MRVFFGVLLLFLGATALGAAPAGLPNDEKKLAALKEDIDSVKVQIEFLDIKVKDSRASVKRLEDKINRQKSKVKNLQDQINTIASESESLNGGLEDLRLETEKSKANYEAVLSRFRSRLVHIHKIKQGTLLDSIFSAKDLNTFMNRFQLVRYLLLHDRKLLTDLQQARADLSTKIESFRQKQVHLADLTESLKKSREELVLEASSLSAMLQTLLMEKKLFLSRQEQLKKNLTDLEGEIGKIEGLRAKDPQKFDTALGVSEVPRKAPGVKQEPVAAAAKKSDQELGVQATPTTGGRFQWPLKKIGDLGLKADGPPPKSLDIKTVAGAEVFAIAGGKVMFKGPIGGFGNMIILGHKNGYTSVYGNLADQWVGMGQMVEAGDLIGQMGNSKDATLHFEIRLAGTNQDPLSLLPKMP